MWEGVGDRTELQHIDPHSIGHNSVSFPFSWAAQPEAWGPTLLGAGFLYRILYPTDWTSCAPSYIMIWRPLFLWSSQIALIQPVHGQGYIPIFLDRMHLLFTQMYFLFWQPGRVGSQYTTLLYIYIYIYTHTHTHIYIYIYVHIYVSQLTIVEGDPKAPFSIANTTGCRGGCHAVP